MLIDYSLKLWLVLVVESAAMVLTLNLHESLIGAITHALDRALLKSIGLLLLLINDFFKLRLVLVIKATPVVLSEDTLDFNVVSLEIYQVGVGCYLLLH